MGNKQKGKGKVAAAQAAAPVMGAAGKGAQPAQVLHMQVKVGGKFGGARAAWYAVLVQHNGQPASAYLAACTAAPPSLPKSGVAESPQGWLSWFKRHGWVEFVPAATA